MSPPYFISASIESTYSMRFVLKLNTDEVMIIVDAVLVSLLKICCYLYRMPCVYYFQLQKLVFQRIEIINISLPE